MITIKAQKAMATFLKSKVGTAITSISSANIRRGIQGFPGDDKAVTKELPRAIVEASGAVMSPEQVGVWEVDMTVRVETSADDDTEDEHDAIADEVIDEILTDTLKTDLSAALVDFSVAKVMFRDCGSEIDGRVWSSFLHMTLFAAESDIA